MRFNSTLKTKDTTYAMVTVKLLLPLSCYNFLHLIQFIFVSARSVMHALSKVNSPLTQ